MSTENPYASPNADLGQTTGRRYVGFWMRVVAALIDSILLMIVLVPLMYFAVGGDALLTGEGGGAAVTLISYVLPAIIYIFFWVKLGGTPGKRMLGMRIISKETGQHLTLGSSVVRYIGYIVSSIVLCIGFIWVAFQSEKRGWHDLMAGSVVVYD